MRRGISPNTLPQEVHCLLSLCFLTYKQGPAWDARRRKTYHNHMSPDLKCRMPDPWVWLKLP